MKKLLSVVCSALLASLFFISCSDSTNSSLSFQLPSALLFNTTDGQTSESEYELKMNFTGDVIEEYSYKFSSSDLKNNKTYTIQDLQSGSEIQITASIYSTTDQIKRYETESPAKVVLQPGTNSANLVLTRCTGSADIDITDYFTIKAEYTGLDGSTVTITSADSEIKIPNYDTDITFTIESKFSELLSYKWYFNVGDTDGVEPISTDASCTINLATNELVNANDLNTLTCIITAGSFSIAVDISFYASETATSED